MARGRRAAADARWLRTHRLGGGLGAHGGGGYIARVEIPHPSTTNGWPIRGHAAADGTPEARFSINQNWPNTGADDVAVVTDDVGVIQERTKYSAYGVPTCLASADYDGNGVVNSTDDTKFQADLSATDPLSDFNFDGATDFFDYLDFAAAYSTQLGESNGRGVLSRSAVGNRFGYAGYQWDPAIAGAAVIGGKWHVRHRVLDAERGTWLTRDPMEFVDGESVYEYVRGGPSNSVDSMGLATDRCPPEQKIPFLTPIRGQYSNEIRSRDIFSTQASWYPFANFIDKLFGNLGLPVPPWAKIAATGEIDAEAFARLQVWATDNSLRWEGFAVGKGTITGRIDYGGVPIFSIPLTYFSTGAKSMAQSWRITCVVVGDSAVPIPSKVGSFPSTFQGTAGGPATGNLEVEAATRWNAGGGLLSASPYVSARWTSNTFTQGVSVGGIVVGSFQVQFNRVLTAMADDGPIFWVCDCPSPFGTSVLT